MPYETKKDILALLGRRQKITKEKADRAQRIGDNYSYYRHNTALHELWKVQDLIQGKPVEDED